MKHRIEIEDHTTAGVDSDDDVHVVPEFEGEREHPLTVECWCGPWRDDEEPRVVVHERRAEC